MGNGSLWGIKLDEWAVGPATPIVTMAIQSVCLLISLTLLIIRAYHMYQNREILKSKRKSAAFQLAQWIMNLVSCIYLFYHEWNYIHLYVPTNSLDCAAWFSLIIIAIPTTRVFLFIFLMLRSSFTFEGTICEISKKISYTLIIMTIISNYVPLIFILTDFTPITPFPDKGFCFRVFGSKAVIAINIMHGSNCFASLIALIVFYWKARTVSKMFMSLTNNGKMNESLMELNYEFKKHTKLGMITVAGTIVVFFFGDMLSVLVGITFALDQTTNNFLTFIMFKESAKYYKWLLCKHKEIENRENVIHMTKSQSTTSGMDETNTNSTTNGDSIVAVLH